MATTPKYGILHDAETNEILRDAKPEEAIASMDVTSDDGIFPADWRRHGGWNGEDCRLCYVDGADLEAVRDYAEKHHIKFSTSIND